MLHPDVPFCRNLMGQYEHPAFLSLLKKIISFLPLRAKVFFRVIPN